MKKIKLIEAFGGIGTFRKALENLGFNVETREYIEWWDSAVKAYNFLYNNDQKENDIKEFEWIVDVFAHGSPCTDISSAGKQDMSKGRSILYMEVLRLIEDLPFKIRPKYIIWENVKNLTYKKFTKHFEYYINKLNDLGYSSTWKILNSKNFGIPQSRERVFVVSIKNDRDNYFNWNNLITKEHKPLKSFLQNVFEIDQKLWFTNEKLNKAIEKGYYKTAKWEFNNNGFCYLPLSGRNSDNKVGSKITALLQASNNQTKVLIPIEYEEYSNYFQLSRETDGKAKSIDKANGTHNRYWKENKLVGPLIPSQINNILVPVNNPKFNQRGEANINIQNSYGQISKSNFDKEGKIIIPQYNFRQSDIVVNEEGVTPTLLENHGNSQKVTRQINDELTIDFCIKNNIAIFDIENKLYAIRHLSYIEYWRLMGWTDEDIMKVKLPKTKMYFLSGQAIVIPVLEAIFQELFKGTNYER